MYKSHFFCKKNELKFQVQPIHRTLKQTSVFLSRNVHKISPNGISLQKDSILSQINPINSKLKRYYYWY